MLKLGLDFDGVIQDSRRLKSEYLADKHGVNVSIDVCKRSQLVDGGFMTSSQYTEMVNSLYETEAGLGADEVVGAIESIKRLIDKFDITVVTSRSPMGVNMAKLWLQEHQLNQLMVIGTNNQDKADLLNGFDNYVDDDLEKLLPLKAKVKDCYLFSWKHNQDDVAPDWIVRVDSWIQLESLLGSK